MLNLSTPINSLGYGIVGYNLWKELTKLIDVTLWPIGGQATLPVMPTQPIIDNINKDIAKQDDYQSYASCLKIWHENQLHERIGRGPFIAFPFFEVNKFDSRRKTHLKATDNIVVASQWARRIIHEQIPWHLDSQIHVVPCGVDMEIFNRAKNKPNEHKCIFFNCGKWEIRKGHDILHRAFKDAFSGDESVELWMMAENPFFKHEEKQQWESRYQHKNIRLIPRVQFQEQVADIMAQVYCGVFPSRSEGWNLEALELMAMGKQVIITNATAHTEFCTEQNSLLIDFDSQEPMYDGKWFVGDNGTWGEWNDFAYDQLVSHLKCVYETWKDNPCKANSQGIKTAREFSWENSAQKILNIIKD
jgi:glycosyltransferase involved in cell wall biosynthesis